MTVPALMSQAAYARYRGVDKSTVSKWKQSGLLVFAEDKQSKRLLIHVERTDARVNANVDPTKGRPTKLQADATASTPRSVDNAVVVSANVDDPRIALVREQIITAALKNAQTARELVPMVECERRLAEIGRASRERIKAALRSHAERLATIHDPRTLMIAHDDIVDEVYASLATDVAEGLLDQVEDSAEQIAAVEADAAAALAFETDDAINDGTA